MQKIVTCLWFDTQAEDAVNFYVSLFNNSKIVSLSRYGDAGPMPAGTVMTVIFELDGRELMALNGGPDFKFNEAISLFVKCETQEEIDRLWETLCDGGEPGPCGWLKDKYGLSWQIVPTVLEKLTSDPDPVKSQRAMKAMLQMKKLDIKALQDAYEGR